MELDLRLKLLNEDLINVTERISLPNSNLLSYLSVLAKLYADHENFTEETIRSLFSSWFILNQSVSKAFQISKNAQLKQNH